MTHRVALLGLFVVVGGAALALPGRDYHPTWYVGAMSNWNAREMPLNCSLLGDGAYEAVIFRDGVNADRDATGYKREVVKVSVKAQLKLNLGPGGGWAGRIYPVK